MRHALRKRFGRLFRGRIPRVGQRRTYKSCTIVALRGGEFDVLDSRGRRRGVAMTWDDARDMADELGDEGHGHAYESGARDVDEMVRASEAATVIPPPSTKTMWGQIEYDKKLKAMRGKKR